MDIRTIAIDSHFLPFCSFRDDALHIVPTRLIEESNTVLFDVIAIQQVRTGLRNNRPESPLLSCLIVVLRGRTNRRVSL